MFFCVLCAKEFKGNNKGVGLERKINEFISFEDAIKQQIPNYEVNKKLIYFRHGFIFVL